MRTTSYCASRSATASRSSVGGTLISSVSLPDAQLAQQCGIELRLNERHQKAQRVSVEKHKTEAEAQEPGERDLICD